MISVLKLTRRLVLALGVAGLVSAAGAQEPFPSRPIRVISPSSPGGPTDITARMIADHLGSVFKVPVLVENKPGANGALALAEVANSAPDGYTIVVGYVSANVLNPIFNPNLPFDAEKDFAPITEVFSGTQTLMVNPSLPATNVREFIEHAKAQKDPLQYGTFGVGSTAHLYGEYLKMLTGIDMIPVPFKSATELMTNMLGGHILVGFLDSTSARNALNNKQLVALAQTAAERSPGLPDVATMVEQGIEFDLGGPWQGIFGRTGTPKEVIDTLNREIVAFLNLPETREKMIATVGQAPLPTTPEEFAEIIERDRATYKAIIEKAGIKLNQP